MNRKSCWRSIVVGMCVTSLLVPPGMQAADGPAEPVAIRDVALDSDGDLRGTLVTADGKPDADKPVVLLKGSEVVGLAKTKSDGKFAIRQVRPGLYELAPAKSTGLYRVWTARTAPPAAQSAALLVQGDTIIRGQNWSPIRRALILGGVIISSGVIGGVIGYNIKDDSAS